MKIVFMGTPDFAVGCLARLKQDGHDLLAVYTQPDKPVGRKQVLQAPPVKVLADELEIPVFQPDSLKSSSVAESIKELAPDVIVVVAYGKILPESILSIPKFGCVNVHASLLPRHRGASPIQWAIVCGDSETGVTTMKMDAGMDTGDILMTRSVLIGENETAGELFDRLALLGAELLSETISCLPELKSIKQPEEGVSYAPIITKDMALLDFKTKSAKELHNAVCGFFPWPVAFFIHNEKRVKVTSSHLLGCSDLKPGTIFSIDNDLVVACADGGLIALKTVKPEGSREMTGSEFARGRRLSVGSEL